MPKDVDNSHTKRFFPGDETSENSVFNQDSEDQQLIELPHYLDEGLFIDSRLKENKKHSKLIKKSSKKELILKSDDENQNWRSSFFKQEKICSNEEKEIEEKPGLQTFSSSEEDDFSSYESGLISESESSEEDNTNSYYRLLEVMNTIENNFEELVYDEKILDGDILDDVGRLRFILVNYHQAMMRKSIDEDGHFVYELYRDLIDEPETLVLFLYEDYPLLLNEVDEEMELAKYEILSEEEFQVEFEQLISDKKIFDLIAESSLISFSQNKRYESCQEKSREFEAGPLDSVFKKPNFFEYIEKFSKDNSGNSPNNFNKKDEKNFSVSIRRQKGNKEQPNNQPANRTGSFSPFSVERKEASKEEEEKLPRLSFREFSGLFNKSKAENEKELQQPTEIKKQSHFDTILGRTTNENSQIYLKPYVKDLNKANPPPSQNIKSFDQALLSETQNMANSEIKQKKPTKNEQSNSKSNQSLLPLCPSSFRPTAQLSESLFSGVKPVNNSACENLTNFSHNKIPDAISIKIPNSNTNQPDSLTLIKNEVLKHKESVDEIRVLKNTDWQPEKKIEEKEKIVISSFECLNEKQTVSTSINAFNHASERASYKKVPENPKVESCESKFSSKSEQFPLIAPNIVSSIPQNDGKYRDNEINSLSTRGLFKDLENHTECSHNQSSTNSDIKSSVNTGFIEVQPHQNNLKFETFKCDSMVGFLNFKDSSIFSSEEKTLINHNEQKNSQLNTRSEMCQENDPNFIEKDDPSKYSVEKLLKETTILSDCKNELKEEQENLLNFVMSLTVDEFIEFYFIPSMKEVYTILFSELLLYKKWNLIDVRLNNQTFTQIANLINSSKFYKIEAEKFIQLLLPREKESKKKKNLQLINESEETLDEPYLRMVSISKRLHQALNKSDLSKDNEKLKEELIKIEKIQDFINEKLSELNESLELLLNEQSEYANKGQVCFSKNENLAAEINNIENTIKWLMSNGFCAPSASNSGKNKEIKKDCSELQNQMLNENIEFQNVNIYYNCLCEIETNLKIINEFNLFEE